MSGVNFGPSELPRKKDVSLPNISAQNLNLITVVFDLCPESEWESANIIKYRRRAVLSHAARYCTASILNEGFITFDRFVGMPSKVYMAYKA